MNPDTQPAAGAAPRRGISAQWLAYLGTSVSVGVFSAFNNFTLTLWLSTLTSSYLVLGLMGSTKSFEGAMVSPVVGTWSDRTWMGWLGRRRPFILVGGLSSALLLALTPSISRLPLPDWLRWIPQETPGLAMAVVAIFLFTLTFNAMDDLQKALLADITSESERNTLSGLNVVVDMGGQVAILVIGFLLWKDFVPDSGFLLTAAIMTAGVLITVIFVKEPPPSIWKLDRLEPTAAETHVSLRDALAMYRGAVFLCLIQFAYWAGVNAVLPLVSIYTRDILGASVGEAQLLPGIMLLTTTLLALPMAKLGDRFGKRRTIMVGYILMGFGALGGMVITNVSEGVLVFILAGVGTAAIAVLNIPLLADLVPRRHMGTATGALAASGSLAAPLASLTAGTLSEIFGPRAIFGLMASMVVVALLLLPQVRPPRVGETAPPLLPRPTGED